MNARSLIRVFLIAVPILAPCVTAPVLAQESSTYVRQLRGSDIPLPEAQFLLYQYVAGSDGAEPDGQLRDQVWARLDIGNARFYALVDHMRQVIDASRAFADSQARGLCARRKELGSVEALGVALNNSMEELRAYQAKLLTEAKPILGEAGEPRFAALVAEYRERMVVSRVDYTALLVAREIAAAAALDDICQQANQEPAQGSR